jgi:hypothetical protein
MQLLKKCRDQGDLLPHHKRMIDEECSHLGLKGDKKTPVLE